MRASGFDALASHRWPKSTRLSGTASNGSTRVVTRASAFRAANASRRLRELPSSRCPSGDLEYADWKDATLHPDCYVYIEGDYHSAPHIHRHTKLRIKITESH